MLSDLGDLLIICLFKHKLIPRPRPFSSQVQIEDVEDEEKRYALFLELLEAAQKWEDFQQLMLLLQAWPPMVKEDV